MKGFIYLLEISIALILMLAVLGTISTFKSKESWERADLITTGNDVTKNLDYQDIVEFLNGNFTKIQSLIPPNVDFGLKITGVPKTNISVGVDPASYSYVKGLLTPSYFNDRWVNFSVGQFDISSLNYIPSSYDEVVFVNYNGYTSRKSNITDYLNKGGAILGINATRNNNDADFNYFFGLSPASQSSGNLNFTPYDPSKDEIEKYFFAIGFDVNASITISSSVRWGYWYIWENSRKVNITNSITIDVENKTVDEIDLKGLHIGDLFNLKNTDDGKFYTFKVENISWSNNLTIIQPISTSLIFNRSFSEGNVTGKVNILVLPTGQAGMASNNTAVWISDFNISDEYKGLVKSAIMSRVKDWYLKNPDLTKEYVSLSSFYSSCCDVPENIELTIYLWYKI